MFRYNLFLYLISPFILIKLLLYSLKNSVKLKYFSHKIFGARLSKKYSIWIHAASIGEMKIAVKVAQHLAAKGNKSIIITSNTPSSKYIFNESKLSGVDHCYLPFDFYFATKKFISSLSAKLLIIVETEIWPNLYSICKKNTTKIITINARFNPPTGLLGLVSKDVYKDTLNKVEHIYCKSDSDMKSFLKYIDESKISTVGNIKHSLVSEDKVSQRLIDKKYVLLASSHHREEIIIIKEWLKLKSNKYILVIAPRHPERLGDILSDIPLSGINIAIRSKNEKVRNSTQIYIADTLGEMDNLIKYSEFTIFGGSFVDVGGHSFIEAAIYSKAIIVGPYMYNFIEETEEFLKNNALIMC
ncbi:MAG: 3-deoxy-D-manno-octulosonic acid transferase, partial [Candidatus Kariarchaeum pelagius]